VLKKRAWTQTQERVVEAGGGGLTYRPNEKNWLRAETAFGARGTVATISATTGVASTGAGSALTCATAQSEQPGLADSSGACMCSVCAAPTNRISSTHRIPVRTRRLWRWSVRLVGKNFIDFATSLLVGRGKMQEREQTLPFVMLSQVRALYQEIWSWST
jgi:hypothetical protein